MAEKKMRTEDEPETSEEREKSGNGEGHPYIGNFPIECDIVNLNALDNEAYVRRMGKKSRRLRGSGARGIGGAQFLVTLKLATPLVFPEAPLTIEIRYIAKHGGILKPSGLFLYNQTDSVTFRSNGPNYGSEIQQFYLQTIRFSLELAGHDAEITIELFYQGVPVGKNPCPITVEPGPITVKSGSQS